MAKNNYKEGRKKVSRLIYMVLSDNLSVQKAVLQFPKDINDASIKTAYYALIHREADEDLRHLDLDYKDEQDDYLEFIAQILNEGNALPENLIKNYDKYYKNIQLPNSKSLKGFLKNLCKFLNV